jgi:hypothetical protein
MSSPGSQASTNSLDGSSCSTLSNIASGRAAPFAMSTLAAVTISPGSSGSRGCVTAA